MTIPESKQICPEDAPHPSIYQCPDCAITDGRLVLCAPHRAEEARKKLCPKCKGPLDYDGYCFRACDHIPMSEGEKILRNWLEAGIRPVENSELLDDKTDRLITQLVNCAQPIHGARVWRLHRELRDRVLSLLAQSRSFDVQQLRDVKSALTTALESNVSLSAEISRLRADRLTDDEAAWLATMIGDEYESITDRGTSALSKIRRISEEGNPK